MPALVSTEAPDVCSGPIEVDYIDRLGMQVTPPWTSGRVEGLFWRPYIVVMRFITPQYAVGQLTKREFFNSPFRQGPFF